MKDIQLNQLYIEENHIWYKIFFKIIITQKSTPEHQQIVYSPLKQNDSDLSHKISVRRTSQNKENLFLENQKRSFVCNCNTKNQIHSKNCPIYKSRLFHESYEKKPTALFKHLPKNLNLNTDRINNRYSSKNDYFLSPVKRYSKKDIGERHSLNSKFNSFKLHY